MSKKFSILKTIDIDKLYKDVNEYIYETGEKNPYIFMCDETANAISEEVMEPYMIKNKHFFDRNGVIAEYCGYRIFSNNELKFGEIELR